MNDNSTYDHLNDAPFIPDGLEYKEEYWYDALAKIEAHERALRMRKLRYIAIAAIFIGSLIGLGVAHFWSSESARAKTLANTGQSQTQAPSSTSPQASPNAEVHDASIPADSHPSADSNATPAGDQAHANSSTADHSIAVPHRNSLSPKPANDASNNHLAGVSTKGKASDRKSSPGSNTSTSNQNQKPNVRSVKRGLHEVNGDNESAIRSEKQMEPTQNPASNLTENAATIPPLNPEMATVAERESAKSSVESDASPENKLALPNEHVAFIHPIDAVFAWPQADLQATSRDWFNESPDAPWFIQPINFQLIAGAAVWRDFSTHPGDLALDPYLRFDVDRNFNRTWGLSAGLELTSISGLTSTYSKTSTTYDFSYINTTTTVSTNRLYYLTLPVSLKYRLADRYQFTAGLGASYLVAGSNSIRVDRSTPSESQLVNQYNDNGYIKGFSKLNYFGSLGFNYWVGKQTSIGLSAQLGLTDITKNNYFTDGRFDRNSRLCIELKRNIR